MSWKDFASFPANFLEPIRACSIVRSETLGLDIQSPPWTQEHVPTLTVHQGLKRQTPSRLTPEGRPLSVTALAALVPLFFCDPDLPAVAFLTGLVAVFLTGFAAAFGVFFVSAFAADLVFFAVVICVFPVSGSDVKHQHTAVLTQEVDDK